MSQKYWFKALFFPLLHVSNNVWIRTATGALPCLYFPLLEKTCCSRADKVKEKKRKKKEKKNYLVHYMLKNNHSFPPFKQMIVIVRKKCWSSQFTVVLWYHNLGKQHLLSLFLKKMSSFHSSHLQEGRKRIKRRLEKDEKSVPMVDFTSPLLSHLAMFFMYSLGKGLFSPHRSLLPKNTREDSILEMDCGQQDKS